MTPLVIRTSLKKVYLGYIVFDLAAIAMLVYYLRLEEPRPLWLLLVAVTLLVLPVFWHLPKLFTTLRIDANRVHHETGFLSKTTKSLDLALVRDVTVEQSIGQRMWNIGNITLEAVGGGSRITMTDIDNPRGVASRILDSIPKGRRGANPEA